MHHLGRIRKYAGIRIHRLGVGRSVRLNKNTEPATALVL